ncbi:FeoB-associated Cys-rich membrane protein [Hymenobacter sp. 15J16-1T3B]|uniref:FeoB-associated Cys-rich membrane protein n=1 Tax=Hymenobacter sp. 15J16-1T3B TaxID=2886941 RepID=UPI001D10FB3C|nr:FeoB-associated Cys-rich membrane protein [Hymenobacter sp. 15J16-1T3B]MCC3156062.1 FeoB-associated Cys-rich membrane protein [Hymenobacter sp. 15J16-1T3B]
MLVQQLIILALFLGAAFYIGRRLWQSFFAKSDGGCPKGCGACSAIDVDAMQRTIEKAQRQAQHAG